MNFRSKASALQILDLSPVHTNLYLSPVECKFPIKDQSDNDIISMANSILISDLRSVQYKFLI